MQKSALARAGRRDDGNHLALTQTEVGIGQNSQAFLATAVDFLQTSGFYHDRNFGARVRSACPPCLCQVVLWLVHGLSLILQLSRLPCRFSYLDATFGTKVLAGVATSARQRPNSFPFPPNVCPPPKGSGTASIGMSLNFFFSIACSGLCLFGVARVTPLLRPSTSAQLYEQTMRQNP